MDELLANESIIKFFQIEDVTTISDEKMALIKLLERCYYNNGENIVTYGADAEDGRYIILHGTGNVFSENGKLIGTINVGDFVGEMALISGKPRSATVQAVGELEAVRISRNLFYNVVRKNPECYGVLMETLYSNLTNVISERQRIKAELDIAAKIQESSLSKHFVDFGVESYASMKPAREVGGDFYDIFKIDDTHICFTIADVSGKGISAALFMLMSKTMLKNYAKLNLKLNEVFETVNNELCEGNDANMFVTAFMGIFDLKTHEFQYVNAGHNPPIIYKAKQNTAEWIKTKPGFVLAGLEDVKYQYDSVVLDEDDIVFMYTDGVTEAQNTKDELFSDSKLLRIFNESDYGTKEVRQILSDVDRKVFAFAGEADQADDITMLAFRVGKNQLKEISVDATVDNISVVTDFVNKELDLCNCPENEKIKVNIAIDELLSNIAKYAYTQELGKATIQIDAEAGDICINFIDSGIPYNPLEHEEPDVTLSVEDRKIGGLGIVLVRKLMDDISYEYIDGKNILKVRKHFTV